MGKSRLIQYSYLFIIIIGFLVYARTLSFGLTYIDDRILIESGGKFLGNFPGLAGAFRQDVLNSPGGKGVYYRPAFALFFIIDNFLSGGSGSPLISHLINLILHVIASCLIFLFFRKLGYRDQVAFLFSAIFSVHPVLTQAVAWIPGRNDVLLTIFTILSFVNFIDFLTKKTARYCIWHMLFMVLALFTKESAVFLPIVCLAYLRLAEREKLFSRRATTLTAGWLAAIGFLFLMRRIGLPNTASQGIFYTIWHILLNSPALIQFVGKAILPFNLSTWPVMKDTSFVYGFVSTMLITAAAIFSKRPRYNFIAFGISWFVVFLAPTLIRLPSAKESVFLEHRIYLPIVGIMIVLCETDFIKKFDLKKKGSLISAALCIIIFSTMTFNHAGDFKDSHALSFSAVRASPHSAIAHTELGYAYFKEGVFDRAEEEFKTAIKIAPGAAFGYNYLGACYMKKAMFKEASLEFRKAFALDPASDDIRHNLINAYFKEGKLKEAEKLLKR